MQPFGAVGCNLMDATVRGAGIFGSRGREQGDGAVRFEGKGREGDENELGQAFYRAARNSADRVDQKYKNTSGLICSHFIEMGHSKQ